MSQPLHQAGHEVLYVFNVQSQLPRNFARLVSLLRELEDMPLIAAQRLGNPFMRLSENAFQLLVAYSRPGPQ